MLMRRLKDLLFPPRCALCDAVIAPRERPLCPACGRACPDVSILGEVCRTCGREKLCCTCKEDSFLSDGIAAPFYYEGVARRGVSFYKRVQDVDRTAFFVKEMANSICRSLGDRIVDVITAVPMRPAEKRERGFDQVEPLAKGIAKEFHIPYVPLLRKCLDTPSQKLLTMEQRRSNLLGAFDVTNGESVGNKRILLLDDVVTTGSTTNECAKMLKIYGADRVYVAAIALTRPQIEQDGKVGQDDNEGFWD